MNRIKVGFFNNNKYFHLASFVALIQKKASIIDILKIAFKG